MYHKALNKVYSPYVGHTGFIWRCAAWVGILRHTQAIRLAYNMQSQSCAINILRRDCTDLRRYTKSCQALMSWALRSCISSCSLLTSYPCYHCTFYVSLPLRSMNHWMTPQVDDDIILLQNAAGQPARFHYRQPGYARDLVPSKMRGQARHRPAANMAHPCNLQNKYTTLAYPLFFIPPSWLTLAAAYPCTVPQYIIGQVLLPLADDPHQPAVQASIYWHV